MEKAVAMGKVRVLGISDFDASDEVFDKIMRESVVSRRSFRWNVIHTRRDWR